MTARRRIGLLALTPIADDPRVRRQGDALHAAGYEVAAFGVAGARSQPPPWTIRTVGDYANGARDWGADQDSIVRRAAQIPSGAAAAFRLKLYRAAWSRLKPLAARAIEADDRRRPQAGRAPLDERLAMLDRNAARLEVIADPSRAEAVYWSMNALHGELLNLALQWPADLWIANDWNTLPIAAHLALLSGGAYAYDTHEMAYDEHAESLAWTLLQRPPVFAVEHKYIGGAKAVTAVSEGISARLQSLHGLQVRPTTIRNTPLYQQTPFRPAAEQVRVLYHGIIVPGRGIEACIRSVASWQPRFDLTLRGPMTADYRAVLEAEIAAADVGGRVHLAPPVPMRELVAEAAAFDIGLFALPGHSKHNVYALPNKLFEYAMAGLALCVSDMPEMKSTVEGHDMGVVFRGTAPAAIAAAINGLSRERIDACKRGALVAARSLCWENEQVRMVALYAGVLEGTQGASARPLDPRRMMPDLYPPESVAPVVVKGPYDVVCYDYWQGAGARVQIEGGVARITTPGSAWHYAAGIELDLSAIDFAHEHCWIRLQVARAQGDMRVSLFDGETNVLHFERQIPPLAQEGELLLMPASAAGSLLLFRNGPEDAPSTLVLSRVEVLTAPKA